MFVITVFVFLTTVPTFASSMTQEEIDAINAQKQLEAEQEIARVKAAAEETAQNELDAAAKTAEAFAEDVERRRDAYEDWVDDQRVLAGLEPIYEDDNEIAVQDEEISYTVQNNNTDVVSEVNPIVIEETVENINVSSNGQLSLGEYDLFCRIIEAEAPNEGLQGKIMVANVILNRVASPEFPNTITSVINAPGQFSPVRSGKINRVNVTEETKLAVNKALEGENYIGMAMYFKSAHRGNTFRGRNYIATSGGNNFFI